MDGALLKILLWSIVRDHNTRTHDTPLTYYFLHRLQTHSFRLDHLSFRICACSGSGGGGSFANSRLFFELPSGVFSARHYFVSLQNRSLHAT